MRLTIIISFLFHCLVSLSQLPMNLKYDQLEYSYDSATVLVYSKSKSAVFDLRTDKFLIDFTKDVVVNYPFTNFYLKIALKKGELSIYDFSNQHEFYQVTDRDSFIYIGIEDPRIQPGLMSMNGVMNTDFPTVESPCKWSKISCTKVTHDIYILNAYKTHIYNETENLPNDDFIDGFNSSGVYLVSEKKWLIDPVYHACYSLNDYYFCARQTLVPNYRDGGEMIRTPSYEYSWDLYHYTDEKMNLIVGDAYEIEPDLIARIMRVDSVMSLNNDKSLFEFIDAGKRGILSFQLYSGGYFGEQTFHCKILLDAKYNLVVYSEMLSRLVVSELKDTLSHTMYKIRFDEKGFGLRKQFQIDDNFSFDAPEAPAENWKEFLVLYPSSSNKLFYQVIFSNETESYTLSEISSENPNTELSNIGVSKINDSLVLVNLYVQDNRIEVVHSEVHPDEDSVDKDGNTIYYEPNPSEISSGVFNYQNGNWFIEPQYAKVIQTANGWICVIESENDQSTYTISLLDARGETVFSSKLPEDIILNDYLEYLSPYKNTDTVFLAPNGFQSHQKWNTPNQMYYARFNGKYSLYNPGRFFENEYFVKPYDFIHVHPQLDILIAIENDSLYFSSPFVSTSMKAEGAELVYKQYADFNDPYEAWELTTIYQGQATVDGTKEVWGSQITTISIQISENEIIINDCTPDSRVSFCPECYNENDEIYTSQTMFYTENSSVWRRTEYGWIKASPYYAGIEKLKHGEYIAHSGKFLSSVIYDGLGVLHGNDDVLTEIPSRYFLLDSNFNAIPFMDYFDFAYIEDLGFGLKVQFNPGEKYFFMTYDHRGITNAEWDDFTLENGKLKAIIHTQYEVDENGELVLDEFGNPIEAVSETIKFFKLR
ncbi:MAG: hypothetical protein IPM74_16760 [Crocinitomicaceae bacterium]|nr:hypothetical protein [Crocinitomicaceae bacterium]MBK8927503.1 hypothetical protein [Crocinitomicaceae bacterium]